MKTKTILLIFIPILALFSLLGASGVLKIDGAAENTAPDKLVGVFLTKEHLDMPFVEDRIYAEGTEFKGLEGIRCFFTLQEDSEGSFYKTTADNGASDRKTHFTSTDSGEKIEQELTLYLQSRPGELTVFVNPVYQSGDGRVYVQTGNGFITPADTAGVSSSSSLSEDYSYTDGRETVTDSSSIVVNFKVIDCPEKVKVLEFDSENALISEKEYSADEMPDSYKPNAKTAYIIIESGTRELYQPMDEYLESFSGADNGLLVKHQTEIKW